MSSLTIFLVFVSILLSYSLAYALPFLAKAQNETLQSSNTGLSKPPTTDVDADVPQNMKTMDNKFGHFKRFCNYFGCSPASEKSGKCDEGYKYDKKTNKCRKLVSR